MLSQVVEAGVDRIMIHVDTGQGLSATEVDLLRERLAERLDHVKVNFGMSFTLYEGREDEIGPLMRRFARYRYFDGILATIARYDEVSGHDGSKVRSGPAAWPPNACAAFLDGISDARDGDFSRRRA